jgi:tetratricopeptide (TPR) repeat protein
VAGSGTGQAAADSVVDLRVDDHPAPLAELGRLLVLHQAYGAMNAGDAALEVGDVAAAAAHYDRAASLAPEQVEMIYWQAVGLATCGQLAAALPHFRRVFAADANWVELTLRLPAAGLLPQDEAGRALLAAILAEAV